MFGHNPKPPVQEIKQPSAPTQQLAPATKFEEFLLAENNELKAEIARLKAENTLLVAEKVKADKQRDTAKKDLEHQRKHQADVDAARHKAAMRRIFE